jgi:hypothetical protein
MLTDRNMAGLAHGEGAASGHPGQFRFVEMGAIVGAHPPAARPAARAPGDRRASASCLRRFPVLGRSSPLTGLWVMAFFVAEDKSNS